MTLLPLLAAASTLLPAEPIGRDPWLTAADYPAASLKSAERGFVRFSVTVAPDGSIVRCEAERNTRLDRAVCEGVRTRARFAPATDLNGLPVFGLFRDQVLFQLKGMNLPPRPDRAVMKLIVDRLPPGRSSPAFARVTLLVDAAGGIARCESSRTRSKTAAPGNVALAGVACAQLKSDYRPERVRDAAGNAVASVQVVTVRFEVKGGG